MPIAVGIATARSNVCRVDDIGVDQLDRVDNAGVEFGVALFDVLAPEIRTFEEFGAFGNFAAEFVGVFLLHELEQIC